MILSCRYYILILCKHFDFFHATIYEWKELEKLFSIYCDWNQCYHTHADIIISRLFLFTRITSNMENFILSALHCKFRKLDVAWKALIRKILNQVRYQSPSMHLVPNKVRNGRLWIYSFAVTLISRIVCHHYLYRN